MSKSLKMNFMNITDLKRILHTVVERINDKYVLHYLQTDIFPYVIEDRTKKQDEEEVVDYFPEEEILKIRESIKRMEAGDRAEIKMVGDRMEKCFPGFKERMTKCLKETEKELKRTTKKELRETLHSLIDNIKSKYTLNILLMEIVPEFLDTKLQRDRKRVRHELLL
jgi:hypothetical protein